MAAATKIAMKKRRKKEQETCLPVCVCVCVLSLKIYARRPFCAAKGNATHVYMCVHERSRRRLTKLKILPFAGRLSFHPPNHQPHPLRLFKKCPPIGVHTHTYTHAERARATQFVNARAAGVRTRGQTAGCGCVCSLFWYIYLHTHTKTHGSMAIRRFQNTRP